MDFFARLLPALVGSEGSSPEGVAVATVIRVSGSTPRHPGAKMAVWDDGRSMGTIGGGRVEAEVTAAAVDVARGGAARRVEHHLVRDLAMCCGGSMEIYVEPLAPSIDALESAVQQWRARERASLVTPLGGGPKYIDTWRGGKAELVGDELDARFVEPIAPETRAVLFGAGHVARAVGPLLAGVRRR